MKPVAKRVLARYLRAKSIGNVHDLVARFERQLDSYRHLEDDVDEVIAAKQDSDELLAESPQGYETLDPDEQRQYDERIRFVDKHKYSYTLFPELSYKAMLRLGARNLFWALIQQYALAPAHLKKVEQYSKFYAKSRLGNKKDLDQAIDFFVKLLGQYREQLATVKQILATSEPRGTAVDDVRVLDAGSFQVVNTGGFDQATMEKAARVVKEADKRMRAKGLGKACYGEVLVSKQIGKSKELAFYLLTSDEMFIRADLEGHESEAVKTMLHELGHRVHFKFLKGWDKGLRYIYQDIKKGRQDAESQAISEAMNDPKVKPQPGDTLIDAKKNEYVVESLSYQGGKYKVHLSLREEPKVKASISLEGYLARKGVKIEVPKASGFITDYAGKNYQENFAEMISHYCMDELPEDQVRMIRHYLDHV